MKNLYVILFLGFFLLSIIFFYPLDLFRKMVIYVRWECLIQESKSPYDGSELYNNHLITYSLGKYI